MRVQKATIPWKHYCYFISSMIVYGPLILAFLLSSCVALIQDPSIVMIILLYVSCENVDTPTSELSGEKSDEQITIHQ